MKKGIRSLRKYHVRYRCSAYLSFRALDGKPAWCEVCFSIRNLSLCNCVSVAYCSKECQSLDWRKHKVVCASSANNAILTEEKAAFARERQKKKKTICFSLSNKQKLLHRDLT